MFSTRITRFIALGAVVASIAGLTATSASASPNTYNSANARCWLGGLTTEVTAPTIVAYGLGANLDWVHKWVRLVDLNGNAMSQWLDNGWGRASQTSPVTFGSTAISRSSTPSYNSRIEVYLQWYRNGVIADTLDYTFRAYDVYTSGGLGSVFRGVDSYC